MLLPTTFSGIAVKKAFFKYMMYLLASLKSHITISVMPNAILELLPIKPSMTFPLKCQVMLTEKKVSCKRCIYVQRLPLATQLQKTSQMRTVPLIMWILYWLLWRLGVNELPLRLQQQSKTLAAAALGVNLRVLLQRDNSKCRGPCRVFGPCVPCSCPGSIPNGELLENHSRTQDT